MIEEIWKPVPEWEHYHVSNLGNVKRMDFGQGWPDGRPLKSHLSRYGYPTVRLKDKPRGKTTTIHRLVMLAFVGPCPFGKEVNHKDGNKQNAKLDNLEYVTRVENIKHSWNTGLRKLKNQLGEKNSQHKLSEKEILKIVFLYKEGLLNQNQLARAFKVSQTAIWYIIHGRNWSYLEKPTV